MQSLVPQGFSNLGRDILNIGTFEQNDLYYSITYYFTTDRNVRNGSDSYKGRQFL
jgi:hypothetical protein